MTHNRKAVKERARQHVKRHYLLLVALCAVSIFLGAEFTDTVSNAQSWYDLLTGQETRLSPAYVRLADSAQASILDDLMNGSLETGRERAETALAALEAQNDSDVLGHQRGVLAAVVNRVSSGHLYATVAEAIVSLFHSQRIAGVIMVLGSLACVAAVWIFLQNMYRAVLRRVFLETRVYDEYPLGHIAHFRTVRRWTRVSLTLFRQSVYEALWSLTVVGGFIKHYSYFLTPYIAAENPDIRPGEAITLSRRMMDGHKWECFLLDLSYLGWILLGYVTFGAADVLWGIPYRVAAYTEYYAALREEAKAKAVPGAERLNDDRLFAPADDTALRSVYDDVARREDILDEDIVELDAARSFLTRNFGIWTGSLMEKKVYSRQEGLRQQTRVARAEMDGRAYPVRMNPLWNRETVSAAGRVSYLAPCTVWSLIAVFFAFCFFGWVWEVSLHLIETGEFVNRGTLYGPWLPIYGGGVALIAVLLYRFRKKPLLEAVLIVVLCGLLEYTTSWLLELRTGMRWWDYTGYFLNLNGRICGEGLAVFAVGGMASVYFAVPLIDEFVTRQKPKAVAAVCIALVLVFLCDFAYTRVVPHTGRGITDTAGTRPASVLAAADPSEPDWEL